MTNFKNLSDEELVVLTAEGHKTAFDEIYNRYWEKLFYVAHRMVKSTEIAEEITQDTFILFWTKKETLDIHSLRHYLAAMLRYEVYRHLAKAKKDKLGKDQITLEMNTSVSIDTDIENRLLLEIVRDLSDTFPEKCRLVFQYNKLDDKPMSEVCIELNISPKTAEAHLTKALKLVRAGLSNAMGIFL